MSESELSLAYDDLRQEVAAFLGYGSTLTALSANQAAEVDRYVQAGYRRFLYPSGVQGVEDGYPWSFLSPTATLATVADVGTQDLPDQLGRVLGQFHFPQSDYRVPVVQVSEDRYQALNSSSESTGSPRVARVRHKAKQDATGQRLEVSWWPIPDAAYSLTYQYEAYTGKLNAANKYPLGGMRNAELVLQSCLAVAERRANDERGLHTEDFERLLRAAVAQDRRLGAQTFGHMGSFERTSALPRHGEGDSHTITYNGVNVDDF